MLGLGFGGRGCRDAVCRSVFVVNVLPAKGQGNGGMRKREWEEDEEKYKAMH